ARANTSAAATTSAWKKRCRICRLGMPLAWYWRQSQIENGDSRLICQAIVRSQKTRRACPTLGSSSTIENAASVATANPPRARAICSRVIRYVTHIGATTSAANFVQAASATPAPRAHGDVTSQKPQMRNAGSRASFVFDDDAYCVNGYAVHANASVAPNATPPKRK